MERKIGEIFTYKGKTYKILKATDGCKGCAFSGKSCADITNNEHCSSSNRADGMSVIFKEINNMKIKNSQITIDIPKGMKIDIENSDLAKGIIKFKPNNFTYKNIEEALGLWKNRTGIPADISNVNKLCAIDKLMNIARYYNKGWKPNWDGEEFKHFIVLNHCSNTYKVDYDQSYSGDTIYFKNREDVQSVINNPNFKEILDAIYR